MRFKLLLSIILATGTNFTIAQQSVHIDKNLKNKRQSTIKQADQNPGSL